jgi:hypothetical protein
VRKEKETRHEGLWGKKEKNEEEAHMEDQTKFQTK